MIFPEIHFGGNKPKLRSYQKFNWQPCETRTIEFYLNQLVEVTLLYSSDSSLFEKLTTLIDGQPISLDLEWSQPWNHSPQPIDLFQFSSSKGTIVVAIDQNQGYDQIRRFLHSTLFFGKGTMSDKKKLNECFGEDFDEIEDIEKTRLLPNNLPLNFESLTMMFLGPGTEKFKDHIVQSSNWSVRPLSILQILYGAHDSYSMYLVYKKIIEKYGTEIKKVPIGIKNVKTKKKSQSTMKYSKCFSSFVNDINEFLDIDKIETNFDDCEMLCLKKPSVKELLIQYVKKKGVVVENEDSCFLEFADLILMFLLPTQPKNKFYLALEKVCLAADLIFKGIIHHLSDDTFVCQVCDKHLHDNVALIQHSEDRHCIDISENHDLKVKDVFLHFLTAIDKVKCPFTTVFDDSKLKKYRYYTK